MGFDCSLFAQQLKQARRRAELTQDGLADKAGLAYSTLAKLEQGAIDNPTLSTICALAGALGVSLDYLVGNTPKTREEASDELKEGKIELVLFDVHDVLVAGWRALFTSIAEQHHCEPMAVEEAFWLTHGDHDRGLITPAEFNRQLASELGIPAGEFDFLHHYLKACQPFPPAQNLVVELQQKGLACGLATDIGPGLLDSLITRGILPPRDNFAVVIESYTIGATKREADFYPAAESQAGCHGRHILLVDDAWGNIRCAQENGWQALRYSQYHHQESAQRIKRRLGLVA